MTLDPELEEFDQYARDILMLSYWSHRLSERGIVSGVPQVTERGMVMVNQLVESGHIVDDDSIASYVSGPQFDHYELADRAVLFSMYKTIKDTSIDALIADMQEVFNSEDLKWYRDTPDGKDLQQKLLNDEEK